MVVLWLGVATAQAQCRQRCTTRLVDDDCEPHGDQFEPHESVRVAVACEEICTAVDGTIRSRTLRGGTPEDGLLHRLRRFGCRVDASVDIGDHGETCGDAAVYTVDLPASGRYRLGRHELVVRGSRSEVAPSSDEPFRGVPSDGFGGRCPALTPEERADVERILTERRAAAARRAAERRAAKERAEITACEGPDGARPPHCKRENTFWDVGDWEDHVRRGWSWESSGGGASSVYVVDQGRRTLLEGFVGSELRLGFRNVSAYQRGSWGLDGARWCAPALGCLVPIVMPTSAFVGNEHGLDVVGSIGRLYSSSSSYLSGSVGLRPLLRVSDGRLRSQSWIGSMLPEVGIRFAAEGRPDFYARWHAYPIDVRLGQHLALSWDGPVVGVSIPSDGSTVAMSLGSGISVAGLWGNR